MFSVAPYAERYLGLLNDKEAQRRYFEADLTTLTKNLNSKYVFLLHGTLEEKVCINFNLNKCPHRVIQSLITYSITSPIRCF